MYFLADLISEIADELRVFAAPGILLGPIVCLFGYRIFKVMLFITGFFVGAALAGTFTFAKSYENYIIIFACLIGGLFGGLLTLCLYYLGVFVIGALFGGSIGAVLFIVAKTSPEPVVLLILAIIGGIVAIVIHKFMIIISTAFGGALHFIIGLAFITLGSFQITETESIFRTMGSKIYIFALLWVLLGLLGVFFQYKTAPKKDETIQPFDEPLDDNFIQISDKTDDDNFIQISDETDDEDYIQLSGEFDDEDFIHFSDEFNDEGFIQQVDETIDDERPEE